jgi:signal transduction histidine kinase
MAIQELSLRPGSVEPGATVEPRAPQRATSGERLRRLWSDWLGFLWAPLLAWALVVLLSGVAFTVANSAAHAQLQDSFNARTGIGADILNRYMLDEISLSGTRARLRLSGPAPTADQLQIIVLSFGYSSAGVMDDRGRVLVVEPYDAALIGKDFAGLVEHVRVAVAENRPAVSQVTISPVLHNPVVGIAVPFETAYGRRIFTGSLDLQGTTLNNRIRESIGLQASELTLMDRTGHVIADTSPLPLTPATVSALHPALAAALSHASSGIYTNGTDQRLYASSPVGATGWRLVSSVPTSTVYQPVQTLQATGYGVLITLGVTGLVAAMLIGLARRRRLAGEEEELRRLNADLLRANSELESFSYSVSHDLRAPLRGMAGFAKLLEKKYGADLPPEASRYTARIAENAEKMGRLIDELLSFSRLGRQQIARQSIQPAAVVRAVVDDLAIEFAAHKVDLQVGVLPTCYADPGLMRHVYGNLISNAVKFTQNRADARVEVGATRIGGETVYFVRDNGAGFEMRYVEKLFAVFQTLHDRAEYPGTGVGLAIVQRIVHRHGGRVWAEGELGQGATFYFTLGGIEHGL